MINVVSNEPKQVETQAVVSEEIKSAPVESTEQKEITASEAEKTDENEVTEDLKDDSDDESDDLQDSENEKPKKKGGFQRRIDKLNARNTAAQEEINYWKQQALKGASEPVKNEVESPKSVSVEGKPSPDSFDTHAEYVEALTDWKIEQREKSAKETEQKNQIKTEREKILNAYSERVKSFSEKNEDFNEVLKSVDDIRPSATLEEIILTSDNGPALAYEIAKNRDEFKRICALSPLAAARELGKIEAKLASQSSEPKQEINKITKAPQPIVPVGSKGGSPVKKIDDPNLSQREYEALRLKQMQSRSA